MLHSFKMPLCNNQAHHVKQHCFTIIPSVLNTRQFYNCQRNLCNTNNGPALGGELLSMVCVCCNVFHNIDWHCHKLESMPTIPQTVELVVVDGNPSKHTKWSPKQMVIDHERLLQCMCMQQCNLQATRNFTPTHIILTNDPTMPSNLTRIMLRTIVGLIRSGMHESTPHVQLTAEQPNT